MPGDLHVLMWCTQVGVGYVMHRLMHYLTKPHPYAHLIPAKCDILVLQCVNLALLYDKLEYCM